MDIIGNSSSETLTGTAGADYIVGAGGNDILTGNGGSDVFAYIAREFGQDTIVDLTAGDKIDLTALNLASLDQLTPFMAQQGADVLITLGFGGTAETILIKGKTIAQLTSSFFTFNTSTTGLEVNGENFSSDVLFGGLGDDTLSGFSANDTLSAGAGADILLGGSGDDRLTGGAGNDVFRYDDREFGRDTIVDLTAGDKIDLTALNLASLDQLTPFMAQQGADVLITLGFGGTAESILIKGKTIAQLTSSFFTFNTSTTGLEVNGENFSSDVLFGGLGNDTLSGFSANDTINAGAGADTLLGGSGDDRLTGGAGNDVFRYDDREFGRDTIVDLTAGDKIDLTALNLASLDQLTPFMAQQGADVLITLGFGGTAESILIKGKTIAQLTSSFFTFNTSTTGLEVNGENFSSDVLFGGLGDDTLSGFSANDTLSAGAGADILLGGSGDDRLTGGAGNDVFRYDDREFGRDTIVDLTAGDKIDLTALNLASLDQLTPFMAQQGADVLITLGFGGTAETILIKGKTIAQLTSSFFTFNTSTTGLEVNGENFSSDVLFGGLGDDTLSGFSANDTINAGAGADTIIGGTGDDRLIGGAGADVFIYDAREFGRDTIVDLAAGDKIDLSTLNLASLSQLTPFMTQEGSDVLITLGFGGTAETILVKGKTIAQLTSSFFTFNTSTTGLEVNGENFSSDVLFGGLGNDTLSGFSGNDTLSGGAGADIMTGGSGNDTYYVDNAGDQVFEDADNGTDTVISSVTFNAATSPTVGIENITLTGSANINAAGNALANVITGNSGNNGLNGGAGADRLVGGLGNDTYTVDNAGDVVVELAGQGTDTVLSSVTFNGSVASAVGIENITLTGSANINAAGNALANVITGNAGNNGLNGGAGADRLVGGLGNDTYTVDNAGDVVVELAGQGTDLVRSSVTFNGSLANAVGIENIILTGSAAINAAGNALDNTITGNDANNGLNGGKGADTLIGGLGNDTYTIDSTGDVIVELAGQGTDTVKSAISFTLSDTLENLTLVSTKAINGIGNAGVNVIIGGVGDNIIAGKGGADMLTGGAGSDTFDYNSVTESSYSSYDRITDLTNADKIDLSGIDANTTVSGNQVFVKVNAFTHHAGEIMLKYDAGKDFTVLSADVNGDGVADMRIVINGDHHTFTNFVF